jgi:hypothetical protein
MVYLVIKKLTNALFALPVDLKVDFYSNLLRIKGYSMFNN